MTEKISLSKQNPRDLVESPGKKVPATEEKIHERRKRPPRKSYQRKTDIYVTKKSNFVGKLRQCEKLLRLEHAEIFLHGIGNAIPRAISLALQIQANNPDLYGVEANTGTVELVDDLHPLTDDADFDEQKRRNSSIHIRVYRKVEPGQLVAALKSVIKGRVSF
ncbi:ribonuclease P protein subunit p20 [Lutzomyia longipalpis]|uniref:ribonuclease P protein subunit p20 n=1 Tax=Lutzomyia longipalpis TaxID=7200 RepID=UPI00248368DF|nr:ribonuclease P protein subunit p20 [Lutzomyia longipalpis]